MVWRNLHQQCGHWATPLPVIPFCLGYCNVQLMHHVGEDKETSMESEISANLSVVAH